MSLETTSLIVSPSKMKPITKRKIINPGNVIIHQLSGRYFRPVLTINPHAGVGGCAPRPRKLNAADVNTA